MNIIWQTASAWAEHGLPNMPRGKAAIIKLAERDGWQWRERAGSGGGREYSSESLPSQAIERLVIKSNCKQVDRGQAISGEILAAEIDGQAIVNQEQELGLSDLSSLNAKQKRKVDAKLAIIGAFKRYNDIHSNGVQLENRINFCDLYKVSNIDFDATGQLSDVGWVFAEIKSFTSNTLVNWQAAFDKKGVAGLAGNLGRHRVGSSKIEKNHDIMALILGMIKEYPHLSAKLVMRALRARFDKDIIPSYRSVQRYLAKWKQANRQVFAAIVSPDKYRSQFQSAAGSQSVNVTKLNQLWEMDSSPGDILLSDGKRHNLIACIDVYSRRLKLFVAKSSNAKAVASCMRNSLMDWGVPQIIKTDNGADYVSKHISRIMAGLSIEQIKCPPFTPEAKPHVERVFGTFSRDMLELLPGYIGHNVAQRKDIEDRKSFAERMFKKGSKTELHMSPEELQRFCDEWCENIYHHDIHGSLFGKTPFQMAAGWNAPVYRIDNERALDVLLSPTDKDGWRIVGKAGIKVDGGQYNDGELGGHEGETVKVLFDEAEWGQIYVFDCDGKFICKAQSIDRLGVDRQAVAVYRKAKQKKFISDNKKTLNKYKREAGVVNIASDIMKYNAEIAGKISSLPRASETHLTDGLDQALLASMDFIPAKQNLSAVEKKAIADFDKEFDGEISTAANDHPIKNINQQVKKSSVVNMILSPADKFRRWQKLDATITLGGAVALQDMEFMGRYEMSAEFKAQKAIFDDFGEDMLEA